MNARISQVTVYRNGALVVRRGRAEPGPVEITGLPLLLSADSLRLRPEAGSVRDLREVCALGQEGPREPTDDFDDERRSLMLEARALKEERRRIEARIEHYSRLAAAPAMRAEQLPGAEELLALQAFTTEKLETLAPLLADVEARTARCDAGLRALPRRRRERAAPPRFTRGVRFYLEGTAATEIELEYFVDAARWVPSYVVDVGEQETSLRLEALVAQATGEDWEGAEIRVSTADLSRESVLPELTSWRIGTAQPRRRDDYRPPPDGLDDLFVGYDRAGSSPGVASLSSGAIPAAQPDAEPPEPTSGAPVPQTLTGFTPDMIAMVAPPPAMAKSRSSVAAPAEAVGARIKPPRAAPRTRLSYAYLRLGDPESWHRGRLEPVDPLKDMCALITDYDPESHHPLLERAVRGLTEARERLERGPLPRGTRAPDGYQQTYTADGRHDVPGDGEWHRLTVLATTAPTTVAYRAVPRSSHDVFRFCRLRPPAGTPLPSGPAQIYIDGVFRVRAALGGTGGGEPIELNLGLEPALRVVERKAHAQQEEKGLVSHTTRVDHSVVVRVRSALNRPATLHVYDRLPVPDTEQTEVKVSLLSSTPQPEATGRAPSGEPVEGALRWTLEVAPGAVSHVAWQYRLELPAKLEVVGGNRRE